LNIRNCPDNMKMAHLPLKIGHVGTPPLKCQGIKTKLIPFIFRSIQWQEKDKTKWIEPFLGSGVVALNLAPNRALLFDTNEHIIRFYKDIQTGTLNAENVRDFLVAEGAKLLESGGEYFYEVRERFNNKGTSLDFLFLNRSCFNGVMRFNSKGRFNVPFCHKPGRFSQAYVTKITNQIVWASNRIRDKNWMFCAGGWKDALAQAEPNDFVYLDPPYIGRHTDYYNSWNGDEAKELAVATKNLTCGFALSMWLENRYRKNSHIEECWSGLDARICTHFYHVGSTESLRNSMDEGLFVKPGYSTADEGKQSVRKASADTPTVLSLPLDEVV